MKISVITVTYNSAATICQTLASVNAQTLSNVEHIIVDGASSDSTLELVRTQGSRVSKVLSERDDGIYDAMNKGVRNASGDLIGFLNADDTFAYENALADIADLAIKNPRADAVYADLIYVSQRNLQQVVRRWRSGYFRRSRLKFGWMPPHPTFFVQKKIYDTLGEFNINLTSAADYELMLRFLYKSKISVCYLPQVLVRMRAGGMSNASIANRIKANKEDREAWRVNQIRPYFFTTWLKPIRKLTQFVRKPKTIV